MPRCSFLTLIILAIDTVSNLVTFLAHETWKKHAQTFQYCSQKNCPVYPGSWKLTYLFNVSYTWYKSLLWASLCISCILQMHVDAWIFCLSKRKKKNVFLQLCKMPSKTFKQIQSYIPQVLLETKGVWMLYMRSVQLTPGLFNPNQCGLFGQLRRRGGSKWPAER